MADTHITIPMARLIELEAAEHERDIFRSERLDLSLLVGRLIRRMRAARTGEGMAAGDDALEQQCIGYLRRKGLTSPPARSDLVTCGGGLPGDPNGEQAALAVEVLVRKYEGAMLRETLREALSEAYLMGAQNILGQMR